MGCAERCERCAECDGRLQDLLLLADLQRTAELRTRHPGHTLQPILQPHWLLLLAPDGNPTAKTPRVCTRVIRPQIECHAQWRGPAVTQWGEQCSSFSPDDGGARGERERLFRQRQRFSRQRKRLSTAWR